MSEILRDYKVLGNAIHKSKDKITHKQIAKNMGISYSYYKKLRSGSRKGTGKKARSGMNKLVKNYENIYKLYTVGYVKNYENYRLYYSKQMRTDNPAETEKILRDEDENIEEISFSKGKLQTPNIEYFATVYELKTDILNWDYIFNILNKEDPTNPLIYEII